MSDWSQIHVRELASDEPKSFIDGDWIESPYITTEGVRLIQTGNIGIGHFVPGNKRFISDHTFVVLGCKEVRPGDVLICRLADPIGRACVAPDLGLRCITSVDVCILRVNEERFDKQFVVQRINQDDFLERCKEVSGGTTRQRISRTNLGSLTLQVPPLPQQRKIARILTTVDNLIEKTEALIAKYQAIKQGMMHDLFTRGVDEHGHLRPPYEKAPELYKQSKLGWIPKEWEAQSVGDVVTDWAVGPRFSGELYASEGNVATLRTTDLDDEGNLDLKSMPLARLNLTGFASHLLRPGDLVISRSGTCGVTAIFPGFDIPVLPGAFLIRFRFASSVWTDFLRRYFNAPLGRGKLLLQAEGGVQKNIRGTSILRIRHALPPTSEQKRISEILARCDSVICSENSCADVLRVTKTGLMQDLLTGKVRVKVDETEEVAAHA